MSTKGYNSYHGRMTAGKKVLLIVLIVVLLLAVAFLVCQKYVVYDANGHITFTFLQKTGEPAEPEPTTPTDPIEVVREEPEGPELTALQATEMSRYFMSNWESELSRLASDDAIMIDVKNTDGDVVFASTVSHPDSVSVGTAADSKVISDITATDRYTVARVACFWDLQYAYALPAESGLCTPEGKIWYDGSAECWLDPGKQAARDYLVSLCKEIADLGVDEILLDYCSYPTTGNFARLDYGTADKTENLTAFVDAVREAVGKKIVLSAVVRDDVSATGANSGVTADFLAENFNRIYVDTDTVKPDTFTALLGADYDTEKGVVPMVRTAPASGSYLLRAD